VPRPGCVLGVVVPGPAAPSAAFGAGSASPAGDRRCWLIPPSASPEWGDSLQGLLQSSPVGVRTPRNGPGLVRAGGDTPGLVTPNGGTPVHLQISPLVLAQGGNKEQQKKKDTLEINTSEQLLEPRSLCCQREKPQSGKAQMKAGGCHPDTNIYMAPLAAPVGRLKDGAMHPGWNYSLQFGAAEGEWEKQGRTIPRTGGKGCYPTSSIQYHRLCAYLQAFCCVN